MALQILSFSCPLLLCSIGALFSEFAGSLALFLDGLVTLSSFLTFAFAVKTNSVAAGFLLSLISCLFIIFLFSFAVEKWHANKFIASLALNLLFSAVTTMLSSLIFKTRSVLSSENFYFDQTTVRYFSIILTFLFLGGAVLFLRRTKTGLYIRITGSDSDVLKAKGVSPSLMRILAWEFSALFANLAGSLLTLRLCCFVPNISSGRGWMALAAVFVGKKKPLRTIIAVVIFCAADFLATNIQNVLPQIPSSFLISFPYLVVLLLIFM